MAVLLPQIDLDLTLTGFEPPEIDILFADRGPARPDPPDDLPVPSSTVCTRLGDLWCLDRIGCYAAMPDWAVISTG